MKYILYSVAFLAILLSLSVFIFDPTHLYYELPWLDIPMHFLGGVGVTSLALAVSNYNNKKISLSYLLLIYFLVAVSWEFFEFIKDLLGLSPWNSWVDTVSDIINGGIGVLFTFYSIKK